MKYKFTRVVARVEITFGVIFILAGIAPAAAAFAVPASWLRGSTTPAPTSLKAVPSLRSVSS
jgi:hypothetical protein